MLAACANQGMAGWGASTAPALETIFTASYASLERRSVAGGVGKAFAHPK